MGQAVLMLLTLFFILPETLRQAVERIRFVSLEIFLIDEYEIELHLQLKSTLLVTDTPA